MEGVVHGIKIEDGFEEWVKELADYKGLVSIGASPSDLELMLLAVWKINELYMNRQCILSTTYNI